MRAETREEKWIGLKMATTLGGNENGKVDTETSDQHQPRIARVANLPPMLTLRGKRMVLKTPTPEDDVVMCEIVSDPLTVQYLPHFHRLGGWTLEEMVERREKLMAAQSEVGRRSFFLLFLSSALL